MSSRAGRKPIPTHIKLVRGNPGRRPLNKDEAEFSTNLPECPAHLNDIARAEWARIAPELVKNGLLTTVDTAALAAYCQAWATWVEASEKMQNQGMIVLINQKWDRNVQALVGGTPAINPYLQVIDRARVEMRAFMSEFGMTPSSRSRVSATPKKKTNAFSDL